MWKMQKKRGENSVWNKRSQSGRTVFMVRRDNGSRLTVLLFSIFFVRKYEFR